MAFSEYDQFFHVITSWCQVNVRMNEYEFNSIPWGWCNCTTLGMFSCTQPNMIWRASMVCDFLKNHIGHKMARFEGSSYFTSKVTHRDFLKSLYIKIYFPIFPVFLIFHERYDILCNIETQFPIGTPNFELMFNRLTMN